MALFSPTGPPRYGNPCRKNPRWTYNGEPEVRKLAFMHLTHLSLTNFRSFARLDLDIPRRVVVLTGNNAQGKTTVLEAIYFLAAFTSFQTHADRQLVNFIEARKDLAVGRLVAEYVRGPTKHRLEIRLVLEGV